MSDTPPLTADTTAPVSPAGELAAPEPTSNAAPANPAAAELVIEAGRGESQYWRDLWTYRELFYFLAWRDIRVRYRQTFFGVAWAVVRPLATAVALTVVFNRVAGLQAPEGVPYPLMVMAGMLPWQFFAQALAECGNSVLNNANLISKVYFPRLITPAAVTIVCFVDLLVAAALTVLLMAWYGYWPDARILALPAFVLLAFAAALGAGLWLSALTVQFRDVRFVVPFVVQLGLYLSPVGFDTNRIPQTWRWAYALNPMVGVIDGFRWAIFGGAYSLDATTLAISGAVTAAILVSGLWYFRRTERRFADII